MNGRLPMIMNSIQTHWALALNAPIDALWVENPPVARALFRMCDINQPIPPELYKAVAEILMFVYKMKKNKNPH